MKVLKSFFCRLFMILCNKIFGIDNKKIIFSSYDSQYSDSPREISERLHENFPKTKIVWIFDSKDRKDIPQYIIQIKRKTINKYFQMATAKVWVNNCIIDSNVWKSQKQFYIQTWHGDRMFKKIGIMAGEKKEKYDCIPKFDLAIAGSEFGKHIYKKAFNYNGKILKIGLPRNDCLINKNNADRIKSIRQKLNIKDGEKIILYAPTYRDSQKNQMQSLFDFDFKDILKTLQEVTNDRWILFLRSHHINSKGLNIEGKNLDNVKDVSSYGDMTDLLLISDILITDYSSCAGDFALTGKNIFLYCPDLLKYQSTDREFLFDLKESPFIISTNYKELKDNIKKINMINKSKNCKDILQFYKTNETGKSTDKICQIIAKEMNL